MLKKTIKQCQNCKQCAHVWEQHAKYLKMITDKLMFGPEVLEIGYDCLDDWPYKNRKHRMKKKKKIKKKKKKEKNKKK